MKLHIKHSFLSQTMDFLYPLSLKGRQSRHRTRLINLLRARLEQVAKEEMDLLKEYAGTDEHGEPKKDENGHYAVKDVLGFQKEQLVLYNEQYVLTGADLQDTLETLKEILANYDGELSGEQAEVYDNLCEQLQVV